MTDPNNPNLSAPSGSEEWRCSCGFSGSYRAYIAHKGAVLNPDGHTGLPSGPDLDKGVVERAFREGFEAGTFAGGGAADPLAANDAWERSTARQALSTPSPTLTPDADEQPFAYAYRYPSAYKPGTTEIRLGTGGREINGSQPIEAIPLYTKPATPAIRDQAFEEAARDDELENSVERLSEAMLNNTYAVEDTEEFAPLVATQTMVRVTYNDLRIVLAFYDRIRALKGTPPSPIEDDGVAVSDGHTLPETDSPGFEYPGPHDDLGEVIGSRDE